MKVGILVPILNEAKAIGDLVARLRERDLFVLVIDDGSTDNSGAIARENGATVIRNEVNQGKGFSLQKGFQYFVQENFDGVITMDGDGQHAISDLDRFFNSPNLARDTVINGNRMDGAQKMPFVRRWTNRFMSWLISGVCCQKVRDSQCGYRFIGADVLKNLKLTSGCYEIESEILIKSSKNGYKIFSVPVQTIYGEETSHINPVRDTIRFFSYLLKEIFSRK